MVAPKSILITPERPRTPGKRNVLFEKEVVIINVGARVPLAEPAATNDELAFDFNPPDSTGDAHYSKGGPRSGTMRIKGGMANMYAKAAAAEEERRKQEEESKAKQEPVLLSGYMKVLKESGMKSSWQKRFITLTSHALAYHRSADAFKAMKSFELNGDCFVREISQRTGVIDCKNALEVVFSRNKSLVLKGVSQRESTEWITAICAAIDVFAPSEDEDEFDFVDEDEFVDEDDVPSRDPAPFSDTPAMVMSSTTTVVAEVKPDGSAHVEAMMETSVSEEVSDSFEWVDEDEARARDTASSTEQSQAEKAKQQEEEEAQKKRDADAQKRKADADAKAKAEADAKAKAKAEADAKAKAKSEAEARAKAKAEADARAKTAAEAKAKAEAEAKAQAEARTKAEAAERERVAQETRKKQEAEELARKEAEKAKQAEEANARSSKIQSRVPTPGPAHHPNFQAHRANRPSGLSGASIKGTKPRGGRVGNLLAMFEPPK